jgi:LmbE family N-acetylglucosaminyl deacetylase
VLKILFDNKPAKKISVLCLGAHSDDIEIGCGGTILRLREEYPNLAVHWLVFGASGARALEAYASAEAFLDQVNDKQVIVHEFRDGFFPYIGGQIKDHFELLKRELSPDLIFTHYRHDLHQDHRLISELTWNTFRDHFILEYEIPKYDGDFGSPNFFVHLDEGICNSKIEYILSNFKTQENRHWFTADLFLALLRLRGIESGPMGKYAEAFYCRKMILGDRSSS